MLKRGGRCTHITFFIVIQKGHTKTANVHESQLKHHISLIFSIDAFFGIFTTYYKLHVIHNVHWLLHGE